LDNVALGPAVEEQVPLEESDINPEDFEEQQNDTPETKKIKTKLKKLHGLLVKKNDLLT